MDAEQIEAEAQRLAGMYDLTDGGYLVEATMEVLDNHELTDSEKVAVLQRVLDLRDDALEDA